MSIKVLVISDYRNFHTARPEASIFIGLAQQGFEITVMTPTGCSLTQEFDEVGIDIIDFEPKKKWDKSEIKTIRNVIEQKDIDIVHAFNSISSVNGRLAAKGTKAKVVLYRGYTGNINWYNPIAYTKYLHPDVDKIFCNSIGVKEYIDRNTLFAKDKTVTINKGHDVAWYEDYEPLDIRAELELPPEAFILINVSNNRSMKGIPYLLKAFNSIPNNLPIHLLLVGRDMDDRANTKVINQGNKQKHLHLLGFRRDALNIVAASDVFVLPSIKGESITKSVIESMSLGTPAIITDIPGNVELVVNGESGIVVPSKQSKPLAEAILHIYHDKDLRQRLGKNARKHIATKLNHIQTIEKTKAMYQSLVK